MALNWWLDRVQDYEKVAPCEENKLEGTITNALIWATMTVDLREITAKNVDEWLFRLSVVKEHRGALVNRFIEDPSRPSGWREEPYYITREDLVRRIGLATNVVTLPRTKWVAKVAESVAYDQYKDGKRLTAPEREAFAKDLRKKLSAAAA